MAPTPQKAKKHKATSDPLLPPAWLVLFYFSVVACTGQFICAADPIQEMLKLNGAFGQIEDPIDRDNAIKSVVGFGMSCMVLSGLPVGLVLDYVGPKVTAIAGVAVHAAGVSLLFFTNSKVMMAFGSALQGCAFQAILNCRMSVTVFFPATMSLVLQIIASATEVSLFLPKLMLNASNYVDVPTVIKTYLCLLVLCGISDAMLVPMKPFEGTSENAKMEDMTDVTVDTGSDEARQRLLNDNSEPTSAAIPLARPVCYWGMSVKQQLCTPHFWIFACCFTANFCRRKHYVTNMRSILTSAAAGDVETGAYWAELFNAIVPLGFLTSILWGAANDLWGITASAFVVNILGVGISTFSMIPIIKLQFLTIMLYVTYCSYIFGLLFSSCATTYGFKNYATLQGLCSTIAGAVAIAMDAYWNEFITDQLNGSFLLANVLVLAMGLVMFVFPVYLYLRPPPTGLPHLADDASRGPPPTGDTLLHRTSIAHTPHQIYDRRSMEAIQRDLSRF